MIPTRDAPTRASKFVAMLRFEDPLLRNSALVMGTNLSNAFAGYLYWVVAARTNAPAAVGLATAAISALNLAALFAGLGVSTGVVDRLARSADVVERNRILTAAAAVTGGAGLLGGLVLLALAPTMSPEVVVAISGLGAVLLLIGVLTQVWGHTLDHVFVAERRAEGMLARNTLHGVVKLLLVILGGWFAWEGARFLLATWVIALVVALLVTLVLLQPRLTRTWHPQVAGLRNESRLLMRPSLLHFVADVGGGIPIRMLPMIVVARAGAEAGGYFYVTWMVGGIIYMASTAVSGNLFAEGSLHPERLDRLTFRSGRLIGLMVVAAIPGCVLLGRPILGIFGADYAEVGFPLLMVIAVSAAPDAFTNLIVARWRVRGWRVRVAVLNIVMTGIVVGLAWAFVPRFGIVWVGWSWVIAQSTGAIGALVVEYLEARR